MLQNNKIQVPVHRTSINQLPKVFIFVHSIYQVCLLRILSLHTKEWKISLWCYKFFFFFFGLFFFNKSPLDTNQLNCTYGTTLKKSISVVVKKAHLSINQRSLSPCYVAAVVPMLRIHQCTK